MGFLSIKATTKLQGLVNVSGFHVDPGYKSTLKFAVYNAGPQSIYLDQGQPMFLIWYASLDQVTEDLYTARPGSSKNITAEDVKRIAGDVASPAELKKQIDEVKTDYDKRLQSVEQRQTILQWLACALIVLILGTMLRAGWLDRVIDLANRSNIPTQTSQQQVAATTAASTNSITLPSHLGYYVLGAGWLAATGSIISAFIARRQKK
jgi:dCTP deaminase